MNMRFLVVAVFALACSDDVRASWLDYSLKNLRSSQTESLLAYAQQPVAVVFFEPRCRWCLKQMRVLEALSEQCRVQPMAIGLNGSVRDLREVLGRSGTVFPAFMASSRLLADIGGVPATPITVVIADGAQTKAVRGFRSADDLRPLLPQASCSGDSAD
ncbi:MAG TPA: hypothetical protein DD979_13490 [Gammaproteobacteria bacterium]|nr:hypothetical protein [Gammaproteobacteria bacterium]